MGREVGSLEKYLFTVSEKIRETRHDLTLSQVAAERNRRADTSDEANLPVHRELHLLLVIWYWGVDLFQLHAKFHFYVPAQRRAEEAGTKIVVTILRIAEHAGEIFRDVL